MDEHALVGGMDAGRGVVRVGDTVRRPGMREPVRALLRHLEAVGFDGAPRHLGTDGEGRHVVSWVPGDVPVPPYPDWALTDAALASLGRLVRDYHEAVATFDATGLTGWSTEWADPTGGAVVCHNDLFPENVVFRNGRVVALIDFDMAGPGRPLWDVAIAAEEWAPLHAPGARINHPAGLDAVRRLGVLAAAYGLEPDRPESCSTSWSRKRRTRRRTSGEPRPRATRSGPRTSGRPTSTPGSRRTTHGWPDSAPPCSPRFTGPSGSAERRPPPARRR